MGGVLIAGGGAFAADEAVDADLGVFFSLATSAPPSGAAPGFRGGSHASASLSLDDVGLDLVVEVSIPPLRDVPPRLPSGPQSPVGHCPLTWELWMMARFTRKLVLCAVLAALPTLPVTAQTFGGKDVGVFKPGSGTGDGTRLAVVVGIDEYEKSGDLPTLRLAEKDAKDVAGILRKSGFKVTLMVPSAKPRPLTAGAILDRVARIATLADPPDTLLFYFSGHGFCSADRKPYVCAYSTDPPLLSATALSLEEVSGRLKASSAKKRMMIIDACRNIPGARSTSPSSSAGRLQASRGHGVSLLDGSGVSILRAGEGRRRCGRASDSKRTREVRDHPGAHPGGTFRMGSESSGAFFTEKPVRMVALAPYFVAKTEVTNAQYAKFCRSRGRTAPRDPGFTSLPEYFSRNPDYPVVNVSDEDAQAYAKWAGLELPTEAQWENAGGDNDTLFVRRRRGRLGPSGMVQVQLGGRTARCRDGARELVGALRHARKRVGVDGEQVGHNRSSRCPRRKRLERRQAMPVCETHPRASRLPHRCRRVPRVQARPVVPFLPHSRSLEGVRRDQLVLHSDNGAPMKSATLHRS